MKMLLPWQEIVGTVKNVYGDTVIFDEVGAVNVDASMAKKLRNYIGRTVAILRTDLAAEKYLVKEME